MTESFHAVPRYAPATRSLRAMSWLVLLMAVGLIVNLACYLLFILFNGFGASDTRVVLWAAIIGLLVILALLPGAVVIARVDATHNVAKQESASRRRKGTLALLRLDLEIYVPAMLRRGDWLIAILLIGLGIEFASAAYLIIGFERGVGERWIEYLLAEGLMIEGFVLATGATGLLVQIVLERLPRRRHCILLDLNRLLFAYGVWIAAPFGALIFGGCLLGFLGWLWMAAITLSSVVTCIFAHLTLRRAICQTT